MSPRMILARWRHQARVRAARRALVREGIAADRLSFRPVGASPSRPAPARARHSGEFNTNMGAKR